ncbi:MAG: hypothetical protein ABWZ27_01905, partial [Aestuariivirgaceae bacterium]
MKESPKVVEEPLPPAADHPEERDITDDQLEERVIPADPTPKGPLPAKTAMVTPLTAYSEAELE